MHNFDVAYATGLGNQNLVHGCSTIIHQSVEMEVPFAADLVCGSLLEGLSPSPLMLHQFDAKTDSPLL
jgi:hypothetical protein